MAMRSDEPVIATRRFERDDGEVLLHVFKPFAAAHPDFDEDPDHPTWNCDYALHFPDGEIRRGSVVGCDGVEALLLVFARVQLDLRVVMDGSGDQRPVPRWLGDENLGLDIIHF
jgi:hypothetical protein